MKKKRIFLISSMFFVLVMIMASCQGSSQATASEKTKQSEVEAASSAQLPTGDAVAPGTSVEGKEVTMILKNLTNPFFISVKEGAETAAKELGINITVLAPLKADNNEEQSQMAEQAIANQADLVIMCPSDSSGIIPAVQKIYEANIPIVNLNTRIGGDEIMWETFVAIENYDAGFQTVTRLAELMEGKGEIIIIEGVTGAQTSIDRTKGALDALAIYPEIKIVAQQSGDYNRAKAMDVVQNLLQANHGTTAIYCCNDEMALGAVEAIDSAGKTGQILVAGCDANADAKQAIKDDKMTLSCDSQPFNQGYQAVIVAGQVLAGESVPEFVKTEMQVVGKEDLN